MSEQDTQPVYDVFIEEDRVTFVRRPEQAAPEPLRFVPVVMIGFHGIIAALALALAAYLVFTPATATIYALADRVPALAHVYALPAISMSKSETVPATGRVHVPAAQARGLVIFYNSLTQPQVIDAGTLLIGNDGEQIVTDQAAYVPAGNLVNYGHASVWAHALSYGADGNIRAGDIYGPCCRAFIQAVNAQFTGGHGQIDYQTVTKADTSTATTDLTAQLQQSLQGRVASLLPPSDTMLTPVPCTTHAASNHAVGAQAQQVMVTVTQTCQPSAYNTSELERGLAALIAGKTPEQARAILARQGIKDAGIRLSWLHDRLPLDIDQIHIVVIYH